MRTRPAWEFGCHHHSKCALDVLDGLGKGGVGRDEVVDGGGFLDGRVGEVVVQ